MESENGVNDVFNCIAAAHWQAVADGNALRDIGKRQVSRVSCNGSSYIVKAYRLGLARRLLRMRVRDFSCLDWLNGLTPPCLHDRLVGDWQLTVFADAGRDSLFELSIADAGDSVTLGHFSEAGKLMAEMHRRNVFHGDTKTPNFVVNSNCPELSAVVIVDCDKLLCNGALPGVKKAFNLAQFLESIRAWHPVESALAHLEAFCRAYRTAAGLDDDSWRGLFLLAMDIAENDRHIEKRTSPEVISSLKALETGERQ